MRSSQENDRGRSSFFPSMVIFGFIEAIVLLQGSSSLATEIEITALRYETHAASSKIIISELCQEPSENLFHYAVMEITLNGKVMGESLIARKESGQIGISSKDMASWGVQYPQESVQGLTSAEYVILNQLPEMQWEINESEQSIDIHVAPTLFESSLVSEASKEFVKAETSDVGAYLNYDVQSYKTSGETLVTGLFDITGFSKYGSQSCSFFGKTQDYGNNLVRLDTSWVFDQQERVERLQIGDVIGKYNGWGYPVRFGGIQYGTNFGIRPQLIIFPMPFISGTLDYNSVVDLYINGMLQRRDNFSPGRFTIENIPVTTGQGDVSLTVTDPSGQQYVISKTYYTDTPLLKSGLADYSFNVGALREGYGQKSNDYGPLVGTVNYLRGINNNLTAGFKSEAMDGLLAGGLVAAFTLGRLGVFSLAGGYSNGDSGNGWLALAGISSRTSLFSYSAQVQTASDGFRTIGSEGADSMPERSVHVSTGMPVGDIGSINVGYSQIEYYPNNQDFLSRPNYFYNQENIISSLSIPVRGFLGQSANLNFYYSRSLKSGNPDIAGMIFTVPLGPLTSLSTGITADNNKNSGQVNLQKSISRGTGWGYGLQANGGQYDSGQYDSGRAEVLLNTDYGRYNAAMRSDNNSTNLSAGVSGSAGIMENKFFVGRHIEESFTMIELPELQHTEVYADNQPMGKTDRHGLIIIPDTRPYQHNTISVDADNIPFDTILSSDRMTVVPGYHHGIFKKFPIQVAKGVTFNALLPDGTSVPAGAEARFAHGGISFPVAQKGKVFMNVTGEHNVIIRWDDKACSLTLDYENIKELFPDLGEYTCLPIGIETK